MSSLSREEKEALLNAKMEQIRQKNAALEKRHKEILADREIAAKTGSVIQPMQVSTSSSNRHSRNMDQEEDWSENTYESPPAGPTGNQGPRNRERKTRDWDNHDNRNQMPAEPHHERPNRERAGQDNGDHISGESNRERPNRDRNRPAPNRGPKHSPRDRNQEPSNESPKDMKGVRKDEDRRSSKYATGRGKRLAKVAHKEEGVEDSGHPRSPGGPRSPRSPGGHLQSPGGHPGSRSPGAPNNMGSPHFPQTRASEEGRSPRAPGGRNQGRPQDAHNSQGPHMDRGPRSQGGRSHPGQARPQDPQLPRSNSPPPDPNFNFLADRSRSGPLPEQRRRNDDEVHRHPRNYGGSNFNQVKDRIQVEKQKSRRGGRQAGDLSVQMTGRERREYAEWKAERDRIDQARIQRQQDQSGEWKRAWDHEKEDFDNLPEPPVARTEPGRRPGAADPHSPDQAPVTQPPLRYAEARDRGRGRQRGRGQVRGRGGRGGHDVVPGDRRTISTQGSDEHSAEPSQELLVVKIDNDYASKFKSKTGRRNEPRKRRSPRSSESSTGSYTAMPVKPSITMVASPTQSVGDDDDEEVPMMPAPRPQRRVGSGRLANGRSHQRREGRQVPKPAPAVVPAAEGDDDDDDEWEDVEDGEVIYDDKGQPIPLTDLDFDDIQDMHNSSAESLDRFIRENTLHIDEETGLAAQLQHQEAMLDDSDDSIPETPEHLCKPNVPNWGVALDLHNTSMSSDTSDPYMMDDAFGSHEPALHGVGTDEGQEDDPSEASTVEDVKTASLVEERSLKADDVKQEAGAQGDACDGDSSGSTSQETSIADEVAASPGPDQPDGDDGSFAESLPQVSVPADSTANPTDSSLSEHSLLSADASSTSLTSEFVDASENQPLTEKEERHVDSKDEDESFVDAGEELEQPKDQAVSEHPEQSEIDKTSDAEEPSTEDPSVAASTSKTDSSNPVTEEVTPVTEEVTSPPNQPAQEEPSRSSVTQETKDSQKTENPGVPDETENPGVPEETENPGVPEETENPGVPDETENSEVPAEGPSEKSPDSASQESSGATSDVPQDVEEK